MATTELDEARPADLVANRLIHAGIGLVLGIGFYLFSRLDDGVAVRALAGGGLAILFSNRWGNDVRVGLFGIAMGLLLGGLCAFTVSIIDLDSEFLPFSAFFISSCVILYVALAFVQTWLETEGRSLPYRSLFIHAWSNALLLAVAVAFTGAAWAVLALWMGLFGLVDITLFKDIFTAKIFVFLFTGAVFGLSVALAKEYDRLIFALRNLVLTLCRFLAPVLAVAAVLFLCVLPFTGLAPLWSTGAATPILLIVMMASVLAVNAVVQDGQGEAGFPPAARYPVMLELVLLPIFAVLAFYSTWLRVDQYGFTPERVYALLLVLIAGGHVLAYSASVVLGRGLWWRGIIRANPILSLVTALLLIAVHLPGLTAYDLSARNQYARLAGGTVAPGDFDFGALKFRLGEPGRKALARIEDDEALAGRAEVAERLRKLARAEFYYQWDQPTPWLDRQEPVAPDLANLTSYMTVLPQGASVPPDVLRQMNGNAAGLSTCRNDRNDCALLALDADGDGMSEYLFVTLFPQAALSVFIAREDSGAWARARVMNTLFQSQADRDRFLEVLKRGAFTLEEPRYKNVRIGDILLVPDEGTTSVE
jgi:hypothetical protein